MPGTPASDRLVADKRRTSVANPWLPSKRRESPNLITHRLSLHARIASGKAVRTSKNVARFDKSLWLVSRIRSRVRQLLDNA